MLALALDSANYDFDDLWGYWKNCIPCIIACPYLKAEVAKLFMIEGSTLSSYFDDFFGNKSYLFAMSLP